MQDSYFSYKKHLGSHSADGDTRYGFTEVEDTSRIFLLLSIPLFTYRNKKLVFGASKVVLM